MAATFRSVSVSAVGTGNRSVSLPAGVVNDDVLIAVGFADPDGAQLTAPSGWSVESSSTSAAGFGRVWKKTASSEGSSYTFTGSSTSDNGVFILAFQNANPTSTFDGGIQWANSVAGGTSHSCPAVSPSSTDAILVNSYWAITQASNTWTPPSGTTERVDATSGWGSMGAATLPLSASGSTGTKTATSTVSVGATYGDLTVSFAIASSATPATVTPAVTTRAVAVPSPVLAMGVQVAPSAVVRAATAPTASVSTNTPATVSPAVTARSVAFPAPTLVLPDARAFPGTIGRAVTTPAPTVRISHAVPPAAISRQVVMPSPTVRSNALASPSLISRPSGVPAPNIDVMSAAPVGQLKETFSTQDTGKWSGYDGTTKRVNLGRLELTPVSGGAGIVTTADFSLNGAELYAEVPQVPNVGNGGTFAVMRVEYGSPQNAVELYWINGTLRFNEKVAGTDSTTSITYDATAHRWWKIGKSGSILSWATSPDGVTWTTRRTKTTTLNPSVVKVRFYAAYVGTEPSPGVAAFDNVNTPKVVVLPPDDVVPDTGWCVEAYDLHTMELQTMLYGYTKLAFLDGINEEGLGRIDLSRTDIAISDYDENGDRQYLPNGLSPRTLVTQAYWWVVRDNNARRFRFIGQVKDEIEGKGDSNDDTITLTGPGHATVLGWGTTLPTDLTGTAKSRVFLGTNWATVWLTLFREAQARNAIPNWITPTFDEYLDSNGEPWVDYGDYEVKPGKDLLALLKEFQGSIGFQWRVNVDGFLIVGMDIGTDRSNTVRFFEGYDIWEAESHLVATDVKSDVYVERGDGFISVAGDTDTRAKWGRRELYFQASSALGDLAGDIYASGTLAQLRKPVFERNFKIDPNPIDEDGVSLGRRVYVDYEPGDFIGYNAAETDGATDFRLLSISIEVDNTGTVNQEITANSRREALSERLRRVLEQNLGGNYNGATTGSSNDVTGGSAGLGEAIGDTKVPGVPVFGTITSSSALGNDGIEQASVQLSWSQPNNTDSSPITDGDHYEIGWRLRNVGDYQVMPVSWDQTTATVEGLAPNSYYQFIIRAVDKANPTNYGAWSVATEYITVVDTTAPDTPATPTVAASLINVQIVHTLGKATGGTYNLPLDLDHFEVHAGTVFNFATSPSTLIGKMKAGRAEIVGNIPAVASFPIAQTNLMYFKVIAVDKTGNRSAASGPASATAVLIDSSHISDLVASKVTSGTMYADVIVGGSFKTGTSGNRAEFDGNGIRLYNPSGANTVNLSAVTGNATITGTFQTSSSGQRILVDASGNGTIFFYPSSGTDYAYINAPQQNSCGVNSGTEGGANHTRVWVTATFAEMQYLNRTTQAQAGGRLYLNSDGVFVTGLAGDRFTVSSLDVIYMQAGSDCVFGMNEFSGVANIYLGTNGGDLWFKAGDTGLIESANGMLIRGAENNNYLELNSGGNGNLRLYGGNNGWIEVPNGITVKGGNNCYIDYNYGGNSDVKVAADSGNVKLSGGGAGHLIEIGSGWGREEIKSDNLDSYETTQAANMVVNSGYIRRSTSTRKNKVQIEDVRFDPYAVLDMRPVTYYDKRQWEENGFSTTGLSQQLGFIAEEVATIRALGDLMVEYRFDEPNSVNYERSAAALVPLLKDIVRRLEVVENR